MLAPNLSRLGPSRSIFASLDAPTTPCKNPRMTQDTNPRRAPPILSDKDYDAASVFEPANLLREARRQKNVPDIVVPEICILDPDGDILRALRREGRTRSSPGWACYHTDLDEFDHGGVRFGIIGCAVGAAFAVLLAEELFVSGCRLLISMTSAGQILPVRTPPYFVIIDRALRDEGTSYHYLPPAEYSVADMRLIRLAEESLTVAKVTTQVGATWTTDAPFRETGEAIAAAEQAGILAGEMEAAALYAFAAARKNPVLCLAHVTNQMGRVEGDFEKGVADGAQESLKVISQVARRWRDQARS